MAADRTNRAVLGTTGLLLTGVGAAGLLNGLGAFGRRAAEATLYDNAVGRLFSRNGPWLWLLIAGLLLLLAVLALLWLRSQLLPDRAGELELDRGPQGRTRLSSAALTAGLVGEIESYRGVDGARARLHGDPEEADLAVTVTLQDRADLAQVRSRVESEALVHARQAVGRDLPVRLDVEVTSAPRGLS